MALALTYPKLRQMVQDWIEEEGLDVDRTIDELIGLGEKRLLTDLDLRIFDSDEEISTTPLDPVLPKPAGTIVARSLGYVNGAGRRVWLEERTPDYLREFVGSGDPLLYTEHSETGWLLAPTPDSSITVHARLMRRPQGLGAGNETTWLSEHMADILFKAIAAEAEAFIMEDTRSGKFAEEYTRDLPKAIRDAHSLGGYAYARLYPLGANPQ